MEYGGYKYSNVKKGIPPMGDLKSTSLPVNTLQSYWLVVCCETNGREYWIKTWYTHRHVSNSPDFQHNFDFNENDDSDGILKREKGPKTITTHMKS